MESKSNAYMETEPIGRLMRRYAVPCIISLLVAALYNIVDQIFIANTSEICESRLHSPSGKNFAISSPRSEKLSRRSRTDFIRQRYPTESAAVSTWPITVATAAPIMPQWKP